MGDTYRSTPNGRGLLIGGIVLAVAIVAVILYFALYGGSDGGGSGGSAGGGYAAVLMAGDAIRRIADRIRRRR